MLAKKGKQPDATIPVTKDMDLYMKGYRQMLGISPFQTLFSSLLLGRKTWVSDRCLLTWKLKETPMKRVFFKLHASRPGLGKMLPTVVATDSISGGEQVVGRYKKKKNGFSAGLSDLARSGLLPTPTTGNNRNSRNAVQKIGSAHQNHGVAVGLEQAIELSLGILPKEFDSWDQVPMLYQLQAYNAKKKKGRKFPDTFKLAHSAAPIARNPTAGKLNPLFVAEMMGFPADWTLLPFRKSKAQAP
jgi:hypothetical protein